MSVNIKREGYNIEVFRRDFERFIENVEKRSKDSFQENVSTNIEERGGWISIKEIIGGVFTSPKGFFKSFSGRMLLECCVTISSPNEVPLKMDVRFKIYDVNVEKIAKEEFKEIERKYKIYELIIEKEYL